MTSDDAYLVAGAGIGGLATAIALARVGVPVHVLEQRADPKEEGAGIQIGPNGMHALQALGVAAAVDRVAGQPEAIVVMDGTTGRCLTRMPLAPRMQTRFGAPYRTVHRADLHGALAERARALPSIGVTGGFRVERIEPTENGVRVVDAVGRALSGRALIGADGVWSVVARRAIGAPAPQFSGRTAARALLPASAVPAAFREAVTGLWLGPRAHIVHYPVRPDVGPERLINIVAIVEGGQVDHDWGTPIPSSDLADAFRGWHDDVARLLKATPEWRRWSLFGRPHLPTWSKDRCTLLGDAAHPTMPFLAQGAVMALEDALTLVVAVAASPRDPDKAFRAYEAARRPRTRRVVDAATRNGRLYHLTGLAAAARNRVLRWSPPDRLIASYDWLYGYGCPVTTAAAPPA